MLINDVPARYRFNIVYVKFIQKVVDGGFGSKFGRLSACYIITGTSYIFISQVYFLSSSEILYMFGVYCCGRII